MRGQGWGDAAAGDANSPLTFAELAFVIAAMATHAHQRDQCGQIMKFNWQARPRPNRLGWVIGLITQVEGWRYDQVKSNYSYSH